MDGVPATTLTYPNQGGMTIFSDKQNHEATLSIARSLGNQRLTHLRTLFLYVRTELLPYFMSIRIEDGWSVRSSQLGEKQYCFPMKL